MMKIFHLSRWDREFQHDSLEKSEELFSVPAVAPDTTRRDRTAVVSILQKKDFHIFVVVQSSVAKNTSMSRWQKTIYAF
jgi:hypothetical protein